MSDVWDVRTNEGDIQFSDSGNPLIDFFSKAGSIYENSRRTGFYENQESALELFKKAWPSDEWTAFKLMLWLRDCRGGAGNRSGFRSILNWMANTNPEWVELNMHWIPLVGRWDDLRALFKTPLEEKAGKYWWSEIGNGNILAAKWCDRSDYPVRKAAGMKIGEFRRRLASIRKEHIVEHKMCSDRWTEINYENVPSVAMARYTRAFLNNDEQRFITFKEAVKSGTKKVKADTIFPHDCVRTAFNGDPEMADLQFEALPVYAPDNSMTIVISDTSGSMTTGIGGSVRAIDVSMGLALYFSSKVDKNNPFYKRFIKFCDEGHLVDWRGMKFSEAIKNRRIFDGAIGGTRIDKALDTILSIAVKNKIPQRLMPKNLLIVSDMQFHQGSDSDESAIELSLRGWDQENYDRPNVIYWNVFAYGGSPATSCMSNVALISGFSPSILKSVLSCDNLSPEAVMYKALEKYSEIIVPEF